MNNYKLTIQYDGGRYKGWQRLGGTGQNTIQGKIENVLTELVGKKTEIIGCSRTDAGVHAFAQVANFKTEKDLTTSEIKSYLHKYLPYDISITEVASVPEDFHSRYNAKEKTYQYRIWNSEETNPFLRKYSMYVEQPLDMEKMRMASQYFIGEHDFTAFSNAKTKKKSKIRNVYTIDISKKSGIIYIRVRGNGFLHNMVRKIVGTLVAVGLGTMDAKEIPAIMDSKQRDLASGMADAFGLYLEKIDF